MISGVCQLMFITMNVPSGRGLGPDLGDLLRADGVDADDIGIVLPGVGNEGAAQQLGEPIGRHDHMGAESLPDQGAGLVGGVAEGQRVDVFKNPDQIVQNLIVVMDDQ